jgi:DNA topoisomerase-2
LKIPLSLQGLNDDGQEIEPAWYCPVVPMVLINGSSGIGTGYSSTIPNYNPREVITNLRKLMLGEEADTMVPWYKGFDGKIVTWGSQKYMCDGIVNKLSETRYDTSLLTHIHSACQPLYACHLSGLVRGIEI